MVSNGMICHPITTMPSSLIVRSSSPIKPMDWTEKEPSNLMQRTHWNLDLFPEPRWSLPYLNRMVRSLQRHLHLVAILLVPLRQVNGDLSVLVRVYLTPESPAVLLLSFATRLRAERIFSM